MPLYAFACADCAHRFDELQGFTAPPPACPRCGSAATKRVLASFQAGPARKPPNTFTPASTRRDHVHHH